MAGVAPADRSQRRVSRCIDGQPRYACDHCGSSYTAEEYDELETICACKHMIVPWQDRPLPCGATSFAAPPPAHPAAKKGARAAAAGRPADAAQRAQPSQPVKEVQPAQPDEAVSSPKKAAPAARPTRLENLPTPSRKRAPRKPAAPEAADAAPAPPPALLEGRVATIQGLVSRPELDHVLVDLKRFDSSAGRWVCSTKGGEQLRIRPEKLQPVEEAHQKSSRLRYEAAPPGRGGKRAPRAADVQPPTPGADGYVPPKKARTAADSSADFRARMAADSISRNEPTTVRKNTLLGKYLALQDSGRDEFVSSLSLVQQIKFATQLSAHDSRSM